MILDIKNEKDIPVISQYPKCRGIVLYKRYLPKIDRIEECIIINSLEDWRQIEDRFPIEMMTVRCDCLNGITKVLPKGETFHRDRVPRIYSRSEK